MIITTTATIEGKQIVEYLDIVGTEYVSNISPIGNVIEQIQKGLQDARYQINNSMMEQALLLGADAVVGISYAVGAPNQPGEKLSVMGTGTAVRLK